MDIVYMAKGMTNPSVSKDFEWKAIADNATKADRFSGYYANGWGGQWLLVLPKLDLVVARTCADGFFDGDPIYNYEMGDLLRLSIALVKEK